MSWMRMHVQDFIGLGGCSHVERFAVLPIKSYEFCISSKGLIRITTNVVLNH